MYKLIGLAMFSVFAMMIIPSNLDASQSEQHLMYGMATIVKNDNQGNEVFQQSVHNQLTDQGETAILEAIFADGTTAPSDVTSFGAICVSDQTVANANSATEDDTAAFFDTNNGLNDTTNLTCIDDTGNVGLSSSVATIGPITFTAGGTNVDDGDVITAIGICQKDTDNSGDAGFIDCELGSAGTGIMLATVGVTSTTLNAGETVDITYTFDISSGTS